MKNCLIIVRNINQSINALDLCLTQVVLITTTNFTWEILNTLDIWDSEFIIQTHNQLPNKLQPFYFNTPQVSSTNSFNIEQFTCIGKCRFAALSECLCELKLFQVDCGIFH